MADDARMRLQDIEDLRRGLTDFDERSSGVFEDARRGAEDALERFDIAIRHARRRMAEAEDELHQCLRAQMSAAQEEGGGWVDCSLPQAYLREAEERVAELVRAQYAFEQARDHLLERIAFWQRQVQEHDLSRAVAYLKAVEDGIEAYLSVDIGRASSVSASVREAQRSSPGPVMPVERREGNHPGGQERSG